MARPSPEEKWYNYTEVFQTNQGTNSYLRTDRGYYRVYASVNTPHYPHAKQWNAHNTYTAIGSRSSTVTVYDAWVGRPDLGWGLTTCGWRSCAVTGSLLDDVQLSNDLLVRTKNAHQDDIAGRKVNLAQAIAERKQVVDMITDTAKRLARAIRIARKGDIYNAARVLGISPKHGPTGSISRDWLALQYGWKPLLQDIHGSCETLAKARYYRAQRIVTKTSRSQNVYNPLPVTFFTGSAFATPGVYERFESHRCRLESVFEVSNELIRSGGQTGITDPATLVWELIPFSFVADWFIPVGNFLARLRFDDGLTFVSALQSRKSTMSGSYVSRVQNLIPYQGKVLSRTVNGSIASSAIRFDRSIISNLSVELPRFKDPFSPTHALNAIALLRVTARR